MQVDDPIITLGGDTAPTSDDNKDRGVEFSYYDTQARTGFYGWDTNYTDLAGHEGGFTSFMLLQIVPKSLLVLLLVLLLVTLS